ncbi:AzlC family ABC transporter permease [Symbiobacterium thermophilum]|uniref:Putative branched-chain amino acid transport protein n=1 Tax=Symbiobacterium thermophilum (strain DSM 24528 / JCM 14929 / IAM 14863 / T) TaxID=292459 RepID=Q67SA1_SYMTH|nr:AzlC family ABC transporter permease [Symbiobacterium thermophilum]BAD39442.1 putative branched-chain amino acid transport protein [Symbiobacterium thermophilum IAM 14863]
MATTQTLPSLPPATFTAGSRAALPIVLGYLPIGFAFGVLAQTAGFSVAEVGLMSLLVYAGSAQFIGAEMFAAGAAAPAIISTTFLVNLRHLLLSTALLPSFRRNHPAVNALLAYGITDETFAVNASVLRGRPIGPGFVAGLHITSQASWIAASVAGALAGGIATNQEALGLDFALSAMFIGLLVPNLRGEEAGSRRVAALVAAALAVAMGLLGQPSWGVIVATVVAATVGVMLR